jgi:O-antigen ligase
LLDSSLALIQQSPWWGVPNYENALQSFRQGEGMIDLVNTYIVIMLNSGVVGLVLFLFPYAVVIKGMLAVQAGARQASASVLGKFAPAFIGMILSMLFTIFTTSTYGVMKELLVLAIALPVVWLKQARREYVDGKESELDLVLPDVWAPKYVGGPRPIGG